MSDYGADAKGGAYTCVGEEIGQIIDAKMLRVEDKNSPYYGWPIIDDEGWDNADGTLIKDGKRSGSCNRQLQP